MEVQLNWYMRITCIGKLTLPLEELLWNDIPCYLGERSTKSLLSTCTSMYPTLPSIIISMDVDGFMEDPSFLLVLAW